MVRPQWPTMDADETIATIDRLGRDVVPAITGITPDQDIDEALLDPTAAGRDVTAGPLLHRLKPGLRRPGDVDVRPPCCATGRSSGRTRCVSTARRSSSPNLRQALAGAELVGGAFYAAGAAQGDRVVLWRPTPPTSSAPGRGPRSAASSRCRSTPTTRASSCATSWYVAQARYAVIDDVQAERWVAVAEHARMVEQFWVIDTGGETRDKAVALLRENGWAAEPGKSSSAATSTPLPTSAAPGPRRDLLHLRHDRPVQGRGDAARPAVLLRRRSCVSLTRLTDADTYMRRRRCSTATRSSWRPTRRCRRRPRFVLPAEVQRQPLDRPRAATPASPSPTSSA